MRRDGGWGAPGTFASLGVAEEQRLPGKKGSTRHGTDTWPGLPGPASAEAPVAPPVHPICAFVNSAAWDLAGGATVQKAKSWAGEGRGGEGTGGVGWEGG